jgi:hypothetical protein
MASCRIAINLILYKLGHELRLSLHEAIAAEAPALFNMIFASDSWA